MAQQMIVITLQQKYKEHGRGGLIHYPMDVLSGPFDQNLIDKDVLYNITNESDRTIDCNFWLERVDTKLLGMLIICDQKKSSVCAKFTLKTGKSRSLRLRNNQHKGYFILHSTIDGIERSEYIQTSDRTTVYQIRKHKMDTSERRSSPFMRPSRSGYLNLTDKSYVISDQAPSN